MSIIIIIQLVCFLIGMIGIGLGVKNENPMLLGYGIFLLVAMNFFGLMHIEDRLKKIEAN